MKKYFAELIGTFVLTFVGCGVAAMTGCNGADANGAYVATALAFGLTIVAMAYSIGNVSGCHINPAVSLGVLINKGMSVKDFVGYVIAQCAGAFVGAILLAVIFALGGVTDMTGGFGSNGLAGVNGSILAGLLVEVLLTFIFVLTILGVTDSKFKHGSFGGLIIGLTLTLVHIFGIGLTGTSVNPARSLGPAIIAAFTGNIRALLALPVFIIGPFVGAALAAMCYNFMTE